MLFKCALSTHTQWFLYTEVEIGFKMTSYCIEKRKGDFIAEVEIKNIHTIVFPCELVEDI